MALRRRRRDRDRARHHRDHRVPHVHDIEISLTVIAAVLTVIGYSLNDTIIIFDRVRENLRTNRKQALYDS